MSKQLPFFKMHALGNDFVVIDGLSQFVDINKIPIPLLAERHRGIGFDQLLLIKTSNIADFACVIYNSDGSEAEQCGNGIRCVARFLYENKLSHDKTLTLETKAGVVDVVIHSYDKIQVTMGKPRFQPQDIPFLVDKIQLLYEINLDMSTKPLRFAVLSMGNPHAILLVPTIVNYPVADIGAKIACHPLFPKGVNVGFIEVVNRQQIRLRTFERGVGETNACGSNACAAVVAGIINDWLDFKVTVELIYGNLAIEWQGEHQPVIMTGEAVRVFDGVWNL